MKGKIYAVGETVFDIIFKDFQPRAAKPGGSAFNATVTLGRLGVPVSFISEVGNDRVGTYIKEFLRENGVENQYVVQFKNGKSALSLAFLNEKSDAEYEFYKDYPSQRLDEAFPEFDTGDFLLFGSFYGLNPVLRPQVSTILKKAADQGALVYYDPNFRSSHLDDLEQLRSIIEENFSYANVVRASDEDLENIYGVSNVDDAWDIISRFCDTFIYTANAHGIDLRTPSISLHLEVEKIDPVSTIGAGDTFNAGILYGLYRRGITLSSLDKVQENDWREILETAALFSREVCLGYENYISRELGKRVHNDENQKPHA